MIVDPYSRKEFETLFRSFFPQNIGKTNFRDFYLPEIKIVSFDYWDRSKSFFFEAKTETLIHGEKRSFEYLFRFHPNYLHFNLLETTSMSSDYRKIAMPVWENNAEILIQKFKVIAGNSEIIPTIIKKFPPNFSVLRETVRGLSFPYKPATELVRLLVQIHFELLEKTDGNLISLN